MTAISVFDRGAAVRADAVCAGQIGQLWGLGEVRIGDALGDAPAPCDGAPLRAADPRDGRRPRSRRRPRRAARGAHPARRAGPADRPPPGRLRGAVRLALRRGAEGGHPGDAGRRVRDRGRASARRRRSASSAPIGAAAAVEIIGTADEPVPGHGRAAGRAGPRSGITFRLEVELGSMPPAFFTAVEETVRATLSEGLLRLGGARLRGDDDARGLLGAAEPRARQVRQEHVEHRRRLPRADAARAASALRPGRDGGARAGAPLRARAPRRHARTGAARAGAARRRPGAARAARPDVVLEGEIPAAKVHALQQRLPALTRGEGVLESAFERYRPALGEPPRRR